MIVDTGTNVRDFRAISHPRAEAKSASQSLPLTFEIAFLFVRGHSSVDGATILDLVIAGGTRMHPILKAPGILPSQKTIPCGAILDVVALTVLVQVLHIS